MIAPRESVVVALRHPISGNEEGKTISNVVVRRLTSDERKQVRRSGYTKQGRGIAYVQAACGLSRAQVREIEQVDTDAIGAAVAALDEEFIAAGEKD